MNTNLSKDFNYYLENVQMLAAQYNGKFIVIKECKVIGVYDTFDLAYSETLKTECIGTFLIQQATADESVFTMSYNNVHMRA